VTRHPHSFLPRTSGEANPAVYAIEIPKANWHRWTAWPFLRRQQKLSQYLQVQVRWGGGSVDSMCRTYLVNHGPCSIPRLVTLMTSWKHSHLFIPVGHGISKACSCGCISWANMAKRRARLPRCFWKTHLVCDVTG